MRRCNWPRCVRGSSKERITIDKRTRFAMYAPFIMPYLPGPVPHPRLVDSLPFGAWCLRHFAFWFALLICRPCRWALLVMLMDATVISTSIDAGTGSIKKCSDEYDCFVGTIVFFLLAFCWLCWIMSVPIGIRLKTAEAVLDWRSHCSQSGFSFLLKPIGLSTCRYMCFWSWAGVWPGDDATTHLYRDIEICFFGQQDAPCSTSKNFV